jgi:2-oxoglutarate dehydrogenase E2 component (dihydrolipoamide succinyltransferase)
MTIEVKVPVLPESVADATVLNWHKKAGEAVSRDENLVDLETDKVVLEVPAPEDGVLEKILTQDGQVVTANDILAVIKPGAASAKPAAAAAAAKPAAASVVTADSSQDLSPAVRRLVAEHNLDASQITGSGKGGRIIKEDVLSHLQKQKAPAAPAAPSGATVVALAGDRPEKRVPMSRMRARIAERLLEAQHNSAMLTTFNEIDLSEVMALRAKYKDTFIKQHDVKLGFMSFFAKAVIEALKRFPSVNASIDGQDVVYHGYYDIGVAVSTERGLVVPVLRNAERMSMADIEKNISDYAVRARDNKLAIEEMQGGTFTITNGGVFGSLISTPIINPPQTAILGMHKIQERAVVVNGEVVARPMMYVALSYDHRLIDGRESVQFLVALKSLLEDPARLLLEV